MTVNTMAKGKLFVETNEDGTISAVGKTTCEKEEEELIACGAQAVDRMPDPSTEYIVNGQIVPRPEQSSN